MFPQTLTAMVGTCESRSTRGERVRGTQPRPGRHHALVSRVMLRPSTSLRRDASLLSLVGDRSEQVGAELLPLIGRSDELAPVAASVERAAAGFGQVLVFEGEAGIGKTRLVHETLARARDVEVCAGAADEVEQRRPFGVLADALGLTGTPADPDRAEVARQLRGSGSPYGVGDQEFGVSEAITGLVERLCSRSSLLLVLEDLHWADPATLACIVRLGRTVEQLPLLLILTARPTPRSPELARLLTMLSDRGAASTLLGPLAHETVRALAEAAAGAVPGPKLSRQLDGAGGNPLLVLEMLAALGQAGAIEAAGDNTVDIDSATAPSVAPSLTILHRLSFLPPEALDVLRMASIIGTSFFVTDLSLLSGRSAAGLAGPVREAMTAGLLAERGPRLEFRHELIRDALYRDLPESLREAFHRDFAQALASAGHPPGRIAEHLLRGARPGDSEAVEWLRRAAEETGRRAPAVAVELLEHAIALADPTDPAHHRLAADRAVALLHSGRSVEGEAACREVLTRRDDPQREGTLRWLLIRSMVIRDQVAESLVEIDEALAQRTASQAERALYHGWAALARLRLGQYDAALELADQAVALAAPTGDSVAISETLHTKAQVLAFRGHLVESAELGVQAVQAPDPESLPQGPQPATTTAGLMLIAADRATEGFEMLHRGRQLNESLGAKSVLALHHIVHADGLFLIGEWDDAVSEIETGFSLLGDGPAWPAMSLGILALIAVRRDDLAEARAHLAAARAAAQPGVEQMREHRTVLAGALLAEAAGRDSQAIDELCAGWDRINAARFGVAFPEFGPELVRRLVAAGERTRATEVTATVESCARHNPGVPNVEGAALVCRGLTEQAPGLLVDAVAAYRQCAQPLGRALACEDAARLLAVDGRGDEARSLLREAHDLLHGIGAHRDTARTGAALRRLGVRHGARATRTRVRTGWAALTATERKVVGFVAQRLSNPEIADRMYLSRRTVETHVSHALAKLELRSRLELAAEAARRATG